MHSATLRIAYATAQDAEVAAQALAPDHDGHVAWRLERDVLVLQVTSKTTLGLIRTVDDLLGCLRALEPDRPGQGS